MVHSVPNIGRLPTSLRSSQVKDQNNAATILRQLYQKQLQPYEQHCYQQEAVTAKLKPLAACQQRSGGASHSELEDEMAAQVLEAMLAAHAEAATNEQAATAPCAGEALKKRPQTQRVRSR